MLTPSRAVIAAYCETIMRRFAPASAAGSVLARWLRWQQRLVGIDFDAAMTTRAAPRRRRKPTTTDRPLPKRSGERLRRGSEAPRTDRRGLDDASHDRE